MDKELSLWPKTLIVYVLLLSQDTEEWTAVNAGVGGHFAAVQDIAWQPGEGQFLLSVSTDQTTRLHAVWNHASQVRRWILLLVKGHNTAPPCYPLLHF